MIIGITGSLGTGKSTVCGLFRQLGAHVIDADRITHGLLSGDKSVKKRVVSEFGRGILKRGRIDRKNLAVVVFGSRKKLKKLCGIIHPRVIDVIKKRVGKIKRRVTVIDAPLLIEAGLHRDMDRVIVVKANRKTQMARCAKMGFSGSEAKRRIKRQILLQKKMRFADFIIDNNGPLGNTRKQVLKIWEKL